MPAAVKKSTTDSTAAKLLARPPRKERFAIDKSARRADVGDGSQVTRGVIASGNLAGEEHLVHVDGSSKSSLPLAVVSAAIAGGVYTPAEINALLVYNKR